MLDLQEVGLLPWCEMFPRVKKRTTRIPLPTELDIFLKAEFELEGILFEVFSVNY